MTSVLRYCLAVSLLMSVVWCGANDDRRRIEQLQQRQQKQLQQQNIHTLHRRQQQRQQLYSRFSTHYPNTPPQSPSSSSRSRRRYPHPQQIRHHITLPILVQTTPRTQTIERLFPASTNANFRFLNPLTPDTRFTISPASKNLGLFPRTLRIPPGSNRLYTNGIRIQPTPRRNTKSRNLPSPHRFNTYTDLIRQNQHPHTMRSESPRKRIILKDEPSRSDYSSSSNNDGGYGQTRPNPDPALDTSGTLPTFLDPANFKLQDMDLNELQTAVDLIDAHIKVKDNDPSAYTGSRVLVLLLREQCFRLQASGDPDIDVFCQRFNNRFRSMLF